VTQRVWDDSPDAMPRSLDHRYELCFPILDARARRKALGLQAQITDDRNSFILTPQGQERRWGGEARWAAAGVVTDLPEVPPPG
jgi:polyphosphate kinase